MNPEWSFKIMLHIWMSHVTHAYHWVMSHIWMSHVPHMNESCHTYEWVIPRIWILNDRSRSLSRRIICKETWNFCVYDSDFHSDDHFKSHLLWNGLQQCIQSRLVRHIRKRGASAPVSQAIISMRHRQKYFRIYLQVHLIIQRWVLIVVGGEWPLLTV